MKNIKNLFLLTLLLNLSCMFAQTVSLNGLNLTIEEGIENWEFIQNEIGFNSGFAFNTSCGNRFGYFDSLGCPNIGCPTVQVINLGAEMNTSILRFPAGTLANYYHFGTLDSIGCSTSEKGYGIHLNENPPIAIGQLANTNNTNYIFHFIEYVKQLERQYNNQEVKVLYVFNLLGHFKICKSNGNDPCTLQNQPCNNGIVIPCNTNPYLTIGSPEFLEIADENFRAIDLLLENGVNILGIELGNELYFPVYADYGVTKENYFEIANYYNKRLKSNISYAGIKTGLVIPNDTTSNAQKLWLNFIKSKVEQLNETLGDKPYDGLVYHDYSEEYFNQTFSNPITKYKGKLLNIINNFLPNGTNPSGTSWNPNLRKIKKLWITEWALNKDSGNERPENRDHLNRFGDVSFILGMNGLFNDNQIKPFLEYNVFHSLLGQVPNATSIDTSTTWGVIGKVGANNDYRLRPEGKIFAFYKDLVFNQFVDSTFEVINGDTIWHTFTIDLKGMDYKLNDNLGFTIPQNYDSILDYHFYLSYYTYPPPILVTVAYIYFVYQNYSNNTFVFENPPTVNNDPFGLFHHNFYFKGNLNHIPSSPLHCRLSVNPNPDYEVNASYRNFTYHVITSTNNYSSNKMKIFPYSSGAFIIPSTIGIFRQMTNNKILISSMELMVFPNPSNGTIVVKAKEAPNTIEIYDMLGKLVYTNHAPTTNNQITLDVAKGVYLVKSTYNEGIATSSIVVE